MPAQRGRIIAGTPRTLVKKGSNAKLIGCPTTKAVKQPPSPARDSTTSKARGSSKGSRGTSKAETHHDHGSEVHYHIHGDLYNDIQAASKARQQKADSSPTKKKAGGGGAPRGSKASPAKSKASPASSPASRHGSYTAQRTTSKARQEEVGSCDCRTTKTFTETVEKVKGKW